MVRPEQLLNFAEFHDVAIIENDYDSEYRHADRLLDPLHRLDRSGRVLYVGTFSKTMTPSLRLGFLVLPDSLVESAVRLRSLLDWQPPETIQATLLRFITDGIDEEGMRVNARTNGLALGNFRQCWLRPSPPKGSSSVSAPSQPRTCQKRWNSSVECLSRPTSDDVQVEKTRTLGLFR